MDQQGPMGVIPLVLLQRKAVRQEQLASWSPTTSGGYSREWLEKRVQNYDSNLQLWREKLATCQARLQQYKGQFNLMMSSLLTVSVIRHPYVSFVVLPIASSITVV